MSPAESALVLTEGKTDWMHLKRANQVLAMCSTLSFYETKDREEIKHSQKHARHTQRSHTKHRSFLSLIETTGRF